MRPNAQPIFSPPILRRLVYEGLGAFDRFRKLNSKIVILTYHSITSDGWRFSVTEHQFRMQMEYMSKHFKPIRLSDIVLYLNGELDIKGPSFAITFDDGYKSIKNVTDYLYSKKIFPTVFVIAQNLINQERGYLNGTELLNLKMNGWEIGSHTARHTMLTELGNGGIRQEIEDSKKLIETKLDMPINYFSYPYGKYDAKTIELVKNAGYTLAVSMDDTELGQTSSNFTIPRIGVDGTHSISEFRSLASPSVITFRNAVKRTFIGKYL